MRRLLATIGAVGVLVVLPASAASAHATLVETSPADGARLVAAPSEVTVTFDEGVEASTGAVRVFSTDQVRVDAGDAGHGAGPEQIRASLQPDLSHGVYVVTWQAVSLDGHPVRGAFLFHVGEGDETVDDSLVSTLLGEAGQVPWAVAGAVARWLSYLAGLAAVGAMVFQRVVLGGDGRADRLTFAVRVAAVTGAVASLAQVPLFAAEATGLGAGALASASALGDALASPVGRAALVRAGALGVAAVAAHRARHPIWVWTAGLGVVAAEVMVGHTITTEPRILVVAADAVHVSAAAVWIGGLGSLIVSFRQARPDDDPRSAAGMVGRFSTVATWALIGLVVAGLTLAWAEVRARVALTSTPYGWTLLGKVAVAAVVIGMGTYNNRVLVPAIVGADPPLDVPGRNGAGPWARLRRTVRAEVVGLVVVLAVTAVLVNLRPAAEAAGISGPFSAYLPFGDGQVNVVVDPNRAGGNQIHVYTLTAAGSPTGTEGDAVLELNLPQAEIGPIVRRPQVAGPGHWVHTGPELAIPGSWEITFRLSSGFDEQSATATVAVQP